MQTFKKINVFCFRIKYVVRAVKRKLCKENKLSYMQCDDGYYHVPHSEGSGFESREGLSIPLVRLSSPGGVPDDDTFFRHTFLVVGAVSTSFFSDSKNFLRWILCLVFLWL
jgi:hypothetical protein